MAKRSLIPLLFLMLTACWQVNDNDSNASNVDDEIQPFPTSITNQKLPTHINIPGTRIFIAPPTGFKLASDFKGLKKGRVTKIEVLDVNGANFYRDDADFSKEKFEKDGYPVLEYKELTVNGIPAKMALIRGEETLRGYSIVLGDSTFSATIRAVFNGSDPGARDQVRQALLSVYYDKLHEVNNYTTAVFTLNESKSIFKFAKREANKYFYSLQGKKNANFKTEPYVMAVNMPIAGLTLEQAADKLLIIRSDHNIGNTIEETTNGFPALTREVYGNLDGKRVIIYQHMVFIDSTAVSIQGVAPEDDFEKYLEEFKKLANTVSKLPARKN